MQTAGIHLPPVLGLLAVQIRPAECERDFRFNKPWVAGGDVDISANSRAFSVIESFAHITLLSAQSLNE